MADYLTIAEADTYAATHLSAAAWMTSTTPQKTAAIAQATREVDGMRFQGQKYTVTQERAFPRVFGDAAFSPRYPDVRSISLSGVWDWDTTINQPVVPDLVKRACFGQALSLLADSARQQRLDAQADGVIEQAAGGVSEKYKLDGRPATLCRESRGLLSKYLLRTGSVV